MTPNKMAMTFEVYEDTEGFWRWRLVADNGRIVADGSEGYDSESNANRAVRRMRTAVWEAKVVEGEA